VESNERELRRQQQELERAYLASDNPRGQSGFGHDETRWRQWRGVIVSAIDRDGTFLDIGCANGHLMESIAHWAAESGFDTEPYGLDISERLVELARSRLPEWSDRFFVGDASRWTPHRPFDFARTELVYVPTSDREGYIDHLLKHVVSPGGRLIFCSYGSSRRPDVRAEPVAELLDQWGYNVAGQREVRHENGRVVTRVAWIDRH
jgi:SAM-dependent methyltransferase